MRKEERKVKVEENDIKITKEDIGFMRQAIDKTYEGIKNGQTPFGACVVKDGKVIACDHNEVWEDTDITEHAEVVAIRNACKKLGTVDLSGCTIYSTVEPCPMCFSAIYWARMSRIVYGLSIEDAMNAGFNELPIHDSFMKMLTRSPVEIVPGVLRDECMKTFVEWRNRPDSRTY